DGAPTPSIRTAPRYVRRAAGVPRAVCGAAGAGEPGSGAGVEGRRSGGVLVLAGLLLDGIVLDDLDAPRVREDQMGRTLRVDGHRDGAGLVLPGRQGIGAAGPVRGPGPLRAGRALGADPLQRDLRGVARPGHDG